MTESTDPTGTTYPALPGRPGRFDNRGISPITATEDFEVVVMRFGVLTSLFGGVALLCLVDTTPGEEPTYVLHWNSQGASTRYVCTDTGRITQDGYRIFRVEASFDDVAYAAAGSYHVFVDRPASPFTLYVGPDHDRRMWLATGHDVLWADGIPMEHLNLRLDAQSCFVEEDTKRLSPADLEQLVRLVRLFGATNGRTDVYEQLGVSLVTVLDQGDYVGRDAVRLPLWLIAWLQHLLSLCPVPQKVEGEMVHLHGRQLRDVVGVPMVKIANNCLVRCRYGALL